MNLGSFTLGWWDVITDVLSPSLCPFFHGRDHAVQNCRIILKCLCLLKFYDTLIDQNICIDNFHHRQHIWTYV